MPGTAWCFPVGDAGNRWQLRRIGPGARPLGDAVGARVPGL